MKFEDNQYIKAESLSWKGVLSEISKSKTALQPIFEAFTNSLEAIKIKRDSKEIFEAKILLKIIATESTNEDTHVFSSLAITDNGIGFNDDEFTRFNTYKLSNKGFKNLGSGRIQYVHYFNSTRINSIFKDDNVYKEREFLVSKDESFLTENAIVKHLFCKEINADDTKSTITFSGLLENSPLYNSLNEATLKNLLLDRYLHYFCYNRDSLPKIEIEFFLHDKLKGKSEIGINDIPKAKKSSSFKLKYSKLSSDGKRIEESKKEESFQLDSFEFNKSNLKQNELKLVSKGEIIEKSEIKLQCMSEKDTVKENRYIFLISGNYIDERDTDTRGVLNIPNKEIFLKNSNIFTSEAILLEQIQDEADARILQMYPEIIEIKEKHSEQLQKLKEMFLLDEETASKISLNVNDSESKILEKFYEAEAKKEAGIDAAIKETIERLDKLNTTSESYYEDLEKEVKDLVKTIPQQNKVNLTHYVARRKIVLELFQKILDKETQIQKTSKRNIDEKLLHNLIFQQSQENPEESDLWLINEDFLYFSGTSESKLQQIQINGDDLLRTELTEDEEKFRSSLEQNRYDKRPDVLLFPQEGKCIIIEFKNPNVNVSEHLNQINNYASLIWNFSKKDYKFHTFYGFLIGENINSMDVRSHDGDFIEATNFDYLFRPLKKIPGFFTTGDSFLYTEVIKYSTLLDRAAQRNQIFIQKLSKTK